MQISGDKVYDLIPQRPPFVLIDSLVEADDVVSKTEFAVASDHILVENGYLSAEGLIENIAQTAAAGLGYHKLHQQKPPAIGYIGAVSKIAVNHLPAVGATVQTVVETTRQVLNVTIVRGRAFDGDQLLPECEMKIFVHEES